MDVSRNNKDGSLHVDEELYSRQLYVMGHDAMRKLMQAKVLVIGLNGLGQEIAKNICLAGVKHVSLFDKSPVIPRDLGAGFYFSKAAIGKPKDESVLQPLSRLNKHVTVTVASEVLVPDWDVIVLANQTMADCISISELSHQSGVKLVLASAYGLFSQIFVDFIDHCCVDKYGQSLCVGPINDITPDGTLSLAEGSKHTLEDDDLVSVHGSTYKVKVKSRTEFVLQGYASEEVRIGGDFEQVREPFQMKFKPLKEALLDESTVVSFDDPGHALSLHKLFFSDFLEKEPQGNKKNKTAPDGGESAAGSKLSEHFHRMRYCLISPMCSVVGGFAAQEVIKGISGRFLPLQQFFYFEEATAFGPVVPTPSEAEGLSSDGMHPRYQDMLSIFGEESFRKLQALRIFLVGAGAIGCENIKNLVMSGLGARGALHATDMDSIEPSNLNRQFLFHEEDIGQLKAEAAIRQACVLNEDYESGSDMRSYNTPVGGSTEDVFSDEFISRIDVILNALDNVEARNYMDMRCVALRKPMVDAGTLGTKGHVQVVLPFRTESYRSTTDSAEASVPMCTIKTFPTTIEHAIEWALEIFRRKFNEEPATVEEHVSGGQGGAPPVRPEADQPGEDVLDASDHTPEELAEEAPKNVEGCLKSALDLFVQLFSTSIQRLLTTFPSDYVTKEGMPFWSPPKRPPTPQAFNINDKLHILFVESSANLFAQCYGIRKITRAEVFKYLENLLSLKEPNPVSFGDVDVDLSQISRLEFEKDSWHADFVHACANLRARNYKIKERSKHFIRGIAGKIIPAIATTTAVVSGLAVLEMIKVALLGNQKEVLNRNAFLDLALPFLAQVECTPPSKNSYTVGEESCEYTLWSRMEFPDMTLQELLDKLKERLQETITMASIGPKIVYWDFCNKYDGNLSKTVSELCCRKPGQLIQYVDVMTDKEMEIEDVAILF